MVEACKRVIESGSFNRIVVLLILISGVLVGFETYPQFGPDTEIGKAILTVQNVILWAFVLEIALRVAACGSQPWKYFRNPWNLFDFVIVGICFLPIGGHFALVFRMARLLRSVRLLSVLPKMQILINALLKSIPSLGYVGILLLLHFYIYAVMGTFLFSQNDPIRFGRLHSSMMSLFQVLTLEGWNDVFATQQLGSDVTYDEELKLLTEGQRHSQAQPLAAAAFFVTFIMLGTMIMLNLFTGVIISSMQEAQIDPVEGDPDASLIHKIQERGFVTLRDELELIGNHIREVAADVAILKAHHGLKKLDAAGTALTHDDDVGDSYPPIKTPPV